MFQSFAISVAMVSLIKKKELHEMQPTDYVINGDEKIFLEEQLKYYFEFSDNRWNLNVVESQLDSKDVWTVTDAAILINRLYNDFIRKHAANQ